VDLWVACCVLPPAIIAAAYVLNALFGADARERRRRKRDGLPQTDHLVEIIDWRPEEADDSWEPHLMAMCSDAGCGWEAFPDDKILGVSEEQQLRELATKYATTVAAEIRRPLG
jgi:hypothetical protein